MATQNRTTKNNPNSTEFNQLQTEISKIFLSNAKRDNLKVDEDYLVMKINEELGEFVQSYLVHKKRCRPAKYLDSKESHREMAKELSDVVGLAFVISKMLKIDLEEALVKKWITREWLKT
jgi:NTP pyrophosphatase (non-canonical NTP hydrolase)